MNDNHCASCDKQSLEKQTLIAGIVAVLLLLDMFFGFIPKLNQAYGFISNLMLGIVVLITLYYSAHHIYRGCWQSFKNQRANMDTLVGIGTGTAWLYSMFVVLCHQFIPELPLNLYFESAIVIVAFINLGALLEQRAKRHTSHAIESLLQRQPKTANVIREHGIESIPVEQVQLDDRIKIKPGEQIPVDGVIDEGQSAIDESMLSGESMPISKHMGDLVFAGTLNTSGSFIFKATRVGEKTTLANIIQLVQQAQLSKPSIARMVDTVSSIFVPAVIVMAIITGLVWFSVGPAPSIIYSLITSVSVLIIACPCALGLATPISIMVGIGKAAQHGILIRNSNALTQTQQMTTLIFDKTGTITQGVPTVTDVICLGETNENDLLQMVASVEQHSEHPLADAIVKHAKQHSLTFLPANYFQNLEGFGVRAKLGKKWLVAGKQLFMQKNKIDFSPFAKQINTLTQQAKTIIYVGFDEEPLGIIAVTDPIREEAAQVIQQLKAKKIQLMLLTGDNQHTADYVANTLGFDQVFAELLPHQKLQEITRLQSNNHIVGMVGDGVNDAPSLAQADVGIAVSSGADVAIESADITIMRHDLHAVIDAIDISNATVRNIQQNLWGAFIYNGLSIPIAAGVLYPVFQFLLNPMIAGAAMAASSLTVVSNASRLRFFKLGN